VAGWFIPPDTGQPAGFDIRRLPLFIPLLSALAGLALTRTDILPIYSAAALLLVAMLISGLFRQYLPVLLLAFGALLGTADLLRDASQVDVDASWLNGNVVISADIEKVEFFSAYRRYRLQHISRADGVLLPGKALLYQHRGDPGDLQLQAGQRIQVLAHWRLPRNYHNPGAFDYRAWCFDHHIALIGSMKGSPKLLSASIPWLEQQRQAVRSLITRANVNDGGVLRAVLLGERAQITQLANAVFAATGTAHLLAISGMHVGMAAAWVFALVWFISTRREAWMVRLPVRNISMLGGFLAAMAYATIAGWPLPAIRAAMMLAAAALAWHLAARSEPVNTLLAALGLVLLCDPSAIASLSLWLSFVATAALLMWAGKHEIIAHDAESLGRRIAMAGKTVLWVSLLATLATLPLIVATFGRVPVYSLPANLIMVPLYGLIVMPAGLLAELFALFGLDSIALPLMQLAGLSVETGLHALSRIAALPAGVLWASSPALWMQAMYAIGMAACGLLLWRGKRAQAACLSVLVLIAWLAFVLHETDIRQPQWIVWDVGQGAASTLLLPGNRVIAVDAPGRSGSRFNGGTTEAAGLRSLGITHLDVLALTHAQSDHLGGALSLMKNMNRIGQLWLPDVPSARADKRVARIVAYARSRGAAIRWLAKGDIATLGSASESAVEIAVLWPPRSFDPANTNNTSLVLAVGLDKRVRMLWPGDIEAEAETAMLDSGLEKTDIMLMPHHGSNTSSQQLFVEALHPSVAIVQTGFANRYGFPKPGVVKRYKKIGAEVGNTAAGALLVGWSEVNGSAVVSQWPENGHGNTLLRRNLALAFLQRM